MAVLFPKKVPAFSRALGESDDNFDFETDYLISAEVNVLFSSQLDEIIQTCIVGIGSAQCKALSDIIDFSESQKVKEFSLSISKHTIMTCSAHKFPGGSLVWLCDTLQNESCYGFGKWVDTLLSSFKFEQKSCVYILACAATSDFQSDLKPTAPFIRILRTAKASSVCANFKVLEPPNIISGFAAALLSHCIYESLPACVIITYYDNVRASSTDQDIASTIFPILRSFHQLQPYILPSPKPAKSTAQNFDQMYI
ncbi:hypothetical protein Aperf_G00000037684 [Anoplocephala perfoliata]